MKGVKTTPMHPHTKLIPEADIYRLVMRSKLPSAVQFEEWVVEEVLPTIRKTGSYSMQPQLPDFTDPAAAAEAWAYEYRGRVAAIAVVEQQTSQLTEQAPMVEFAEAVIADDATYKVGEAAKMLGVGPRFLFQFLRDHDWMNKDNSPRQSYINAKAMKYKMFHAPDGDIKVTPLVTGRGLKRIHTGLLSSLTRMVCSGSS